MSKKLSVGVIGCGYWGQNLLRNFENLAGPSLTAICDTNEARLAHLEKRYPNVTTYADDEEFLTKSDAKAVAIATPVESHFELAKACLLAGKHTFIEKPMATRAAECEELIEIADRKGLVLMTGHTYLYSAPVRKIAEIIRQGEIGAVRNITCRRLNLGLYQKDINVAWDLAPHDISIVLHLMGEFPETVNCQGACLLGAGIEDATTLSLSFSDNRLVTIHSSWISPRKVREMIIVGTRKMIVYDDLQPHEPIRVYDVRVDRAPHYDRREEFHYSYHHGTSYIPHIHSQEPLAALCQHFLDCIGSGVRPISGGPEGRDLVRVLEAATQSLAHRGAPVTFDAASPAKLHSQPAAA